MFHLVKQTSLGDITSIASSTDKYELMDSLKNLLGDNYEIHIGNVYQSTLTLTKYKVVEEFEYFMLLKRQDVEL